MLPYNTYGFPIMAQLIADITQARMQAASSVASSVADAVTQWSNNMSQFSGGWGTPYRPTNIVTPPPTSQWRGEDIRVNGGASRQARVALIEGDEKYRANVELPNVDASDISVKAGNDRVEINADGNRTYFYLPRGVDAGGITAEYHDGVLTLEIPKEEKAARHEVKVKTGKSSAAS
jgi:HSP20 family molecular chaperone IbpA